MAVWHILSAVFGARAGKDGLFDFLGKRAAGKTAVAVEEELNTRIERAVVLMRPGMSVRWGNSSSWGEIVMPACVPGQAVIIDPPGLVEHALPPASGLAGPQPGELGPAGDAP